MRMEQHSIRASQVSAGEVRINRVEVNPSPVAPGGQVQIKVSLAETAEFIGPNDPDLCNPAWSTTGIRSTVIAQPSWGSTREQTGCVPVYNTWFGEKEFIFQLSAPPVPEGQDTATGQVDIQFYLPGSGKESNKITADVAVDPSGEDSPSSNTTNVVYNDGTVADDQTKQAGFLDGILGGQSSLVLLVFLLIVLVIVINASE